MTRHWHKSSPRKKEDAQCKHIFWVSPLFLKKCDICYWTYQELILERSNAERVQSRNLCEETRPPKASVAPIVVRLSSPRSATIRQSLYDATQANLWTF